MSGTKNSEIVVGRYDKLSLAGGCILNTCRTDQRKDIPSWALPLNTDKLARERAIAQSPYIGLRPTWSV